MNTQKLTTTDGFVVTDLDGPETAVAAVRTAPKILVSGAREMARSLTYRYALLNHKVGGASAGINAKPDDRAEAISRFVEEVRPLVTSGAVLFDPAGAVSAADLAPLTTVDPRDDIRLSEVDQTHFTDRLIALGAHAAADEALGGLGAMAGKTIVIDGFGATGPTLAAAAVAYGAKVIAISTSKGTIANPDGFAPVDLASTWAAHGVEMVNALGEPQAPSHIVSHACDVIYAGSKMGSVNHTAAGFLDAKVLVPITPVPFTTKAMLILREKGTTVLPDFLTTSGPSFAEWPSGLPVIEAIEDDATQTIRQLTATIIGADHGPTMEACYRAESFLRSWQDELPFGRPFAA